MSRFWCTKCGAGFISNLTSTEEKKLCPTCSRDYYVKSLLGELKDRRVNLNHIVPLQYEEFKWEKPTDGNWIKTVCFSCNQGCDALVKVGSQGIEEICGDPQTLENPDLIISNGGKLCAKGLSEFDRFSHKDRITHPLKKKADGSWQKITWEEALDIVSNKMKQYKEAHGKESIVFCRGTNRGWDEYFDRFVNAFGSYKIAPGIAQCFHPRLASGKMTLGGDAMECPDMEKSNTIMVWGANPAATWPKKIRGMMKGWARGAKIIAVDPVLSETASKADIVLQLRPGTDSALAMGMINVILSEELYDIEFVENWCVGFEQLRERAACYPLQKVSEITGIPAERIAQAARAYATGRPSSLCQCVAIEQNADTLSTCRALAILIAITGNLDVPGGNVFTARFGYEYSKSNYTLRLGNLIDDHTFSKILGAKEYPLLAGKESLILSGRSPTAHNGIVFNAIISQKPYPIKMMYTQGCNMLRGFANTAKVKKAISALDFFVVVDLFMTETAEMADIVLPAGTWLERTAFHHNSQVSYNSVHLQKKVANFQEAWDDFKIISELARKLDMGEHFFADDESYAKWKATTIDIDAQDLDAQGGIISKPLEYWRYKEEGFSTPSGKVEIYSKDLHGIGLDPLPGYIEPAESPLSTPELFKDYPYILTTGGKPAIFRHSEYREVERLNIKLPNPPAFLHPDIAKVHDLQNGEQITIISPRGKVHAIAEVTAGITPRVIQVPHGWAGDKNVNNLTDDENCSPGFGSTQLRGLLCNLQKGWI